MSHSKADQMMDDIEHDRALRDKIERLEAALKKIASGTWNVDNLGRSLSVYQFARRALEEKT